MSDTPIDLITLSFECDGCRDGLIVEAVDYKECFAGAEAEGWKFASRFTRCPLCLHLGNDEIRRLKRRKGKKNGKVRIG